MSRSMLRNRAFDSKHLRMPLGRFWTAHRRREHIIVAAGSRAIGAAVRRRTEAWFRLILVAWVIVTIATLWVAIRQSRPRSAQPSSVQSLHESASFTAIPSGDSLALVESKLSSRPRREQCFYAFYAGPA